MHLSFFFLFWRIFFVHTTHSSYLQLKFLKKWWRRVQVLVCGVLRIFCDFYFSNAILAIISMIRLYYTHKKVFLSCTFWLEFFSTFFFRTFISPGNEWTIQPSKYIMIIKISSLWKSSKWKSVFVIIKINLILLVVL